MLEYVRDLEYEVEQLSKSNEALTKALADADLSRSILLERCNRLEKELSDANIELDKIRGSSTGGALGC